MDDRKDFGTLDHSRLASATAGGLYGPSAVAAAAAAAVNSGLMQLPSLADTAGRLGVMEGCPVGLTPAFGCPPGLHVDYPGGAISGIGSLAQLRGWYGPGPQNQGSPYSDLFGAYAGPGSNWRSLSTPPAPDHFHSPLPGMTHPMWPCPPTPVPCSDGCSLSYCNPPSLYSAYSAYISSLMSSSGASEYPPYLSPRLPGPPPIPSYQQRLHDMHKAYLLSNSAGGNATSEFPSHWNPYLTGSSAAVPLLSPGYIGSVGQVGFGFSGDSSSTSSRCISVEEQKQSIKQEPLPNKTKTKDVMSADHRSRDGTRRDQQQLWERSSISRQEPLTESKAGLVTKKLLKDEKLPSPIANDCSLDMCNNNINHDKKQHLVNGSKSVGQNFNVQATGGCVRSTETPETLNSVEFKPHLKSLQSPRQNDDADDGRNSRLSHVSRSGKEGLNESLKVVSRVQMTPELNCCPSLCSDLREANQSTNAFSFSAGTGQNGSDAGSSISQADDQLVQDSSTGCLLVSDLTSNSKIDIELPRASSADDMPAAVSSDNTSANITATSSSSHPMTGDSLHDSDSRNDIFSSTPSDKPTNGTSCIIQHSVYFEEISNDGIDADAKTDAEGECDEVDEKLATGVRCDVTPAASLVPPPFSKLCDNSIDSSQQPSHNTKTELSHLVSPLPVPFPLPSSASAALSFVSMSPSLSSISNATMSMSSPSMSSSSSDVSAFSSAALKVPSILKDEAQNIPLQATALTLYVDSSVKPPKTSVSDGVNCASGQEIDLAMPRQSMRYQVSHQRHNPMQDGCKVHAPTFRPEVCTLLSNAITTTITVSSSGGSPSSLRGSASSTGGRNNGNPGLTSKTPASQRPGRSSTKSRNCAGGQNVTDISIKTEKQMKFSTDSSSPIESREIVSSGKGQTPSLLSSTASCTSGRTHTLLDRVALADHPSSQPAVHMDISVSKAWSQSVVGGSLFGSILPSNYLTCLSSSSGGQYATTDQRHSIRCSASQFTIAHMSMPPAVASASSKCTSVGHHVEGRDLPLATVPIMSHSVVGASFAIRNVEDPLSLGSVTSTRSTDSSGVSQWDDDNGVPENLSTKPTVSEAEMATSEIVKQRQLGKPALLSSLNRDGLPVSRHPANSQVDGSSGNNIPVGIARALQRTIPQPAPACSSEDVAHISPDVSLALDRPLTTDGKPDNTSSNGILSSDEHAGEKTGALCTNSSQVDSENGPGSGASSDKQPCWRNDSETMRSPLFPTSFNRAWLPPGGKPPTHPASINPATLWMGQFPFAPGALLPYSAGSIDRSPSQHLFHPTGGYKLAQDSITGQFFFIPVPDMPWPNLGPRHIFQDPTMQLSNKEKETICATRAAEDGSPSRLFNRARSEEVRADVTSSVATQAGHPSNDISASQHSDLSSSSSNNNCLPSKMDHHSLPEGPVEINPLGQYPIVYPAARPPYFFCDSNLFVHESDKQKEKTRISVESRGTSPILQHPELDLLEFSENTKEKERVSGAKGEADHEKTTLNASVQTTNQSSPSPQSPEKAFTAEISIQTSDISDSDSDDSLSTAKQKPKFSKLKRQSSLCNKIIKLKDSNKHVANDVGLNSKAKEYTGLINRTVKDPALSDITSDEDECDPSVILTRQSMLSRCLLNREDASEAQKSEIAVCCMDQSMQEFQCSSLLSHPDSEQLNKRDVTGTGFSDLIQAATTEFGSSRSTDNCQDAETLLTSLIAESDNQGLDGLLMLSVVASKHTPAAVSEIPHKATNITDSLSFPVSSSTENNAGCPSVRRFNIFDLPISSLIEAERSPDVSASYNVPKPCFFDEKEFNIDLNDCVRHQNGSEPATEDFKSGILKSDEGPENMDPMELDLRMKMAEVQMKYKQEQKELARLQRKSCDLRNNSSQKRKKTKPVSKQTLQRKSSTGKRVSGSSDSSTDSSSDDEEPNPKFSKKNSKSKTDVKFTASSNAVSNLTEDVNGIKIKVSNPQRRASSASVSSSSSQFQKKSISSQKEHRLSKDSSDSGKDSRTLKPFARISMSEMDGELNPVFEKAMPGHSDNADEERAKMLEMNKRKPDLPRKFNSVTEDMLLPKKPKQFCFYSYKKSKSSSSATLNSLDKDIKKHKYRIADSKKSTKQKHLTKAEAESHKTVDDWYRRRSERIFLHEASVGSVSSPPGTTSSQISGLDDRSLPSSPTKTNSKSRSQSQDVAPKSLASSLKSELSVTVKPCTPMTSDNLSTKRLLVSSDSSGNDSNSDSDSDTDNAPLSTLVQKESPTGLKPCTIGKDDLADGLRVLYLKDELFYEGTVKAIQPPDVYRISIDGERSSRQEIVSQEQLLERAILNVRPTSKDQLAEGCRICAYWSQKFSCLYPGTVKTDGFESDDDDSVVNVEFDDGDTGKIPLAHISMLPPGYQIQESRHPAITLVSRKRRNTTDEPEADQLQQQRPSLVNRSMSVGGDSSAQYHPLDRLSRALADVCSRHSSSIRPKSGGKSETRRSMSQELKGKKDTQEYSCRLKTEGGATGKPATASEVGLISKKSSQKGDVVENCERDSSKEHNPSATDQKKSHLTLTIKRKQSIDKETGSSIDEDEYNGSSSDDEMPRSHRYHERRKKSMRLERIDSRSASDSDEMTAAEAAKRKGDQKRKRRSSNKTSKSKKRHRSSSSESGDQIGAFRPVWEQWQWHGPCTKRPGMKGRAKKRFYRAIQRGNEILKVGEAAVFVSMGHNDLQYVGCIDCLWESWDGNMVVKVKWYYHPEETKGGKRLHEIKSALYQSSHEDENDVQTVSHKCEVLSYTSFKKFQAKKYHVDCRPEDVFYLAGTYDPTISMITYEPDVPLNSH